MALSLVNSSDKITANTSASVMSFNEMRSVVDNILRQDYGYQAGISTPVVAGQSIARDHWSRLINDMQIINVHLYNSSVPFILPAVGAKITADFTNQIIERINLLYSNRYRKPNSPDQLSNYTISSTRTADWVNMIEHEVTITWSSDDNAKYFFNLGGQFTVKLSHAFANPTNTKDVIWRDLINSYNNQQIVYVGDYFRSNSTLRITKASPSSSSERIELTFSKTNNRTVTILIQLFTAATPINTIDVTSSVYMERSIEGGPIPYENTDYYGIAASMPQLWNTKELSGGGTPPPFVPTKILTVSPLSFSFSALAGSSTLPQNITFGNIGNTEVMVSNVAVNLVASGVTSVGIQGLSGVLPANTSRTFQFYFTTSPDSIIGTTSGIIEVSSPDNDGAKIITIPVTLTITPILFDYILVPATKTWKVVSNNSVSQKFSINVTVGSYSSYTASFVGTPSSGYSISNTVGGPTVTFNPANLQNGIYSAILSVTINGVTKTASISTEIAIPQSAPLGTWLSAKGPDNSVVGVSYDIINDVRYVTLGFGMGGDGSKWVKDNPGFPVAQNLQYNGDDKYDQGPILYEASSTVAHWNSFLKPPSLGGYGAWIRPTFYNPTYCSLSFGTPSPMSIGPEGAAITRTYKFNCSAGLYNWEFGCDNYGSFGINSQTNLASGNFITYSTSGSIYLNDGENTVTFTVVAGSNAAVAIRISNAATGEDAWSTKAPIRAGQPFVCWDEVYRIPLTGSAQSYNVADYCIKDPSAYFGKRWGSMYETGCMFLVKDDGLGNIDIGMRPLLTKNWWDWEYTNYYIYYSTSYIGPDITTMFTPFAFYYNIGNITYAEGHYQWNAGGENAIGYWTWVSDPVTIPRLNNLTPNNMLFLGFDRDGTVRTALVSPPDTSYPSRPETGQYPPDGSQGGVGGPGGVG